MPRKIQDADVKSVGDVTSPSSLINDTKIYVSANSINKQLSQAITDGDISGGGGGVGSVDSFYIQQFEDFDLLDLETGNSATALASGTLDGTMSLNTTTPIAGTTSLRYTQGASSLNDWIALPVIPLESKQSEGGQLVTLKFRLRSTHDQGDLRFFFANGATDAILETYDNLDVNQADNRQFAITLFIPGGAPSLKIGQQVLISNPGATFDIDDIEFTQNNVFTEFDTQEEIVDLSSVGSFSAGSLKVTRVGDQVTIDRHTAITHSNLATITAAAVVPTWARPSIGKSNIYSGSSGGQFFMSVEPSGNIEFAYRDNAGGTVNRTSPGPCGISYSIDATSSTGIVSSLESVSPVKYLRSTAQSIPNSSTVIVDFATKEYDDFGLVTTGAGWQYEAHSSGVHNIHSKVKLEVDNGWSDGETFRLFVSINGTDYLVDFKEVSPSTTSGFEMALQCSVPFFLNRGDTVSIKVRQNSGAAINLDVIDGYNFVAIEKVDKSAIGAFPMASAQGAGLVSYYNSATINLTGSGSFTGGNIFIERIANSVTIAVVDIATHTSLSSATSASGLLPDWARPSLSRVGVYDVAASIGSFRMTIQPNGTLAFEYANTSLAPVSRVNAGSRGSITYFI